MRCHIQGILETANLDHLNAMQHTRYFVDSKLDVMQHTVRYQQGLGVGTANLDHLNAMQHTISYQQGVGVGTANLDHLNVIEHTRYQHGLGVWAANLNRFNALQHVKDQVPARSEGQEDLVSSGRSL